MTHVEILGEWLMTYYGTVKVRQLPLQIFAIKIAAWSDGYAYNLKGPLPMNAANPSVGQWANGTFSTYALAVMGSILIIKII